MKSEIKSITVKKLLEMDKQGKIKLPAYQRGAVKSWLGDEKTIRFIDSIVDGYYIPPIVCHVDSQGVHWLDDGQQRLSVINRTFKDMVQFTMTTIVKNQVVTILPDKMDNELYQGMVTKQFSSWPDSIRNAFLNRSLPLTIISDFTDEQLVEQFSRVQKGAPLTPQQSRRGQYLPKLMTLNNALQSSAFKTAGLKQSEIETIIMQLIHMLNKGTSLDSALIVESVCNWIVDDVTVNAILHAVENFESIMLEYAQDNETGQTEFKRCLKKTHLESILFALIETDGLNLDSNSVYSSIRNFFAMKGDARTSEKIDYNNASLQNTASAECVKTRHEIMTRVVSGTALKAIVPEPKEKIPPLKKPSEVKSGEKKNRKGHTTAELMESAEK